MSCHSFPRSIFLIFVCLRYNANEHPIPFHKAQDLGKAPKKIAGEPAPDLEEAYDVSSHIHSSVVRLLIHPQLEDDNPDAASDDEGSKKKKKSLDDFSTDKLIKSKAQGKGKGKGKA